MLIGRPFVLLWWTMWFSLVVWRVVSCSLWPTHLGFSTIIAWHVWLLSHGICGHVFPWQTLVERLQREELQARCDLLSNPGSKATNPGPVFDCVVFHDGETWRFVNRIPQLFCMMVYPIVVSGIRAGGNSMINYFIVHCYFNSYEIYCAVNYLPS